MVSSDNVSSPQDVSKISNSPLFLQVELYIILYIIKFFRFSIEKYRGTWVEKWLVKKDTLTLTLQNLCEKHGKMIQYFFVYDDVLFHEFTYFQCLGTFSRR